MTRSSLANLQACMHMRAQNAYVRLLNLNLPPEPPGGVPASLRTPQNPAIRQIPDPALAKAPSGGERPKLRNEFRHAAYILRLPLNLTRAFPWALGWTEHLGLNC